MDWVASKLENLSVGLALLMVGNLPLELFPPAQLRTSRDKGNKDFPTSGEGSYTVATEGGLWRIYQEARVISAATQSVVRLFIHLPIIEVTKSFELF
jgi:hypothetical protein